MAVSRLSGGRVAVFTLGGTIAMARAPGESGVAPALTGRQLLDAVPGLPASARRSRYTTSGGCPGRP